MPRILVTLFSIFMLSCSTSEPIPVQLVFDYGNQIQLNGIGVDEDKMIVVGGDRWEFGTMFSLNLDSGFKEDEFEYKHSFLDLYKHEETWFGIGINNVLLVKEQSTWTSHQLDSSFVARSIVSNSQHIITVGGVAFFKGHIQITDRESFKVLNSIKLDRQLNEIIQIDLGKYIAVGYGGTYTSIDNGASWILNDIEGDFFKGAYYNPITKNCFIIGQSGLVYKTIDGITFEKLRSKKVSIGGFENILETANGQIIIFGQNGLFKISSDEGESWHDVNTGYDLDFLDAVEIEEKIFITSASGKIIGLSL